MRILFLSLFFMSINYVFACDACATLEYGNIQNKNYINLSYAHRALNGYNTSGFYNQFSFNGQGNFKALHQVSSDSIVNSQEDQEAIRSYELLLNYHLKNNWFLRATLPYNIQKVYFKEIISLTKPISDSSNTLAGLGDMSVYLEKAWRLKVKDWMAYLRLSPGIQLPTGKDNLNSGTFIFDPASQPGSGVYAFLFRTNNTLVYKGRLGFNVAFNYKKSQIKKMPENSIFSIVSGQAYNRYQFGDRLNTQINSFYILNFYHVSQWIIRTGVRFEKTDADIIDAEKIDDIGGDVLFAQFGFCLLYTSPSPRDA